MLIGYLGAALRQVSRLVLSPESNDNSIQCQIEKLINVVASLMSVVLYVRNVSRDNFRENLQDKDNMR